MRKLAMPAMALATGLLAGCCGGTCGNGSCGEPKTAGLTTDHLVSPANIGATPSFGWQMCSAKEGAAQTAYRIMVKEGSPNGQCVWDSGEVACGKSVGVKYAGTPLKSATKYFWTVAVKDEAGAWLKPSPGFFETGLFRKDDWNGSVWISAADAKVRTDPQAHGKGKQEAEDGTACFVKAIPNGKAVQEAYWTVAGLGAFEAYVNGEPVSRKGCKAAGGKLVRDFLKPGFTHNGKTKHSFTYDVTHLMKTGAADANVFAAQVSAGWWREARATPTRSPRRSRPAGGATRSSTSSARSPRSARSLSCATPTARRSASARTPRGSPPRRAP